MFVAQKNIIENIIEFCIGCFIKKLARKISRLNKNVTTKLTYVKGTKSVARDEVK